jgi:ADP-heptose:LPS heptosyltransferase
MVRLWAVGESILVLPMIERLRKSYPKATITIITTSRVKAVFENQPFIDEVRIAGVWLAGYWNHYDLVIDAEPYLASAGLIAFWTGIECVGYGCKSTSPLYTRTIEYKDDIHAADNFIRLAAGFGVPSAPVKELTSLKPGATNETWATHWANELSMPLVGICPFAGDSAKSREWSIEKWVELLQRLKQEHGVGFVIVSGKDNAAKIDTLRNTIGFAVLDTIGFSLKQTFAVLPYLSLMISIDTGPMHMAAAQGVPTIGLFCPNTPVRFGPLGKKNGFVYKPVRKEPCINVQHGQIPDCAGHRHMSRITVEDVEKAIQRLEKRGYIRWKQRN